MAFAGTVKLVKRGQERQSGWGPPLRGAISGAVVVLVVGAGLGSLIEGLAPAPLLVAVAVAGAVFGALAWGAVSYDRRTRAPIGGPS